MHKKREGITLKLHYTMKDLKDFKDVMLNKSKMESITGGWIETQVDTDTCTTYKYDHRWYGTYFIGKDSLDVAPSGGGSSSNS